MLLSKDYKTLKLCDFGTVANQNSNLCDNKGSAAWMAPENFQGERFFFTSFFFEKNSF